MDPVSPATRPDMAMARHTPALEDDGPAGLVGRSRFHFDSIAKVVDAAAIESIR